MSTARRLERIEQRLGIPDEDGDGEFEDVPVLRSVVWRRLLLALRWPLCTPEQVAEYEAAEARRPWWRRWIG